MMYNSGLVAVVKSNGKILREDKDVCFLPFNSEYSLLIKNLETRTAVIKISIDGQDVLDGTSLVLRPNTQINLEGFLKGNQATNKFKFINKTQGISDYRGDRIDDGIIRIEYWFEKYQPSYIYINSNYVNDSKWNTIRYSTNSNNASTYYNNSGITVKGSVLNQNFNYTSVGVLEEESRVIILRLVGFKETRKLIKKPLTIQTKKICTTCGKKSRSNLRFCSNCGTFLE